MIKKFNIQEIGSRLRKIRKKLGKTLEEMRDITGLSKSGISDMELGLKKPSSVYMHELNINFNVNINWLLTGEGTMFAPDIEFNLNFGKDNDLVKDLIFCLEYVDTVRYDILKHFTAIKSENEKIIKAAVENRKNKQNP